jgi:hypothetical protein
MRKSTVFISSVLTTFAMVILYGVVKAYQSNAIIQTADVPVQPAIATVVPTDVPTQTSAVITPEEAAQLAAQVVGHDNLLSAETSNFNGVDAYLVTFTNKDMVYIGLDGQVLSVQIAPVFVNVAPPVKKNNNNNNNNQSSNNNSGEGEHEEHDD